MMSDKETKKVLADEKVTVSISKLKRDKVPVNINPKKFLLEHSKQELEKLEKQETVDMNPNELALYKQMKETYQKNVTVYSEANLDAVLVPLRYRDLQAIKDSVLEAVKYAITFNWDDDIKMRAMIREEHTMTVYLALRKKDNMNERYYGSLEDIAAETESTIEDLYTLYVENFVLSDEERKNS